MQVRSHFRCRLEFGGLKGVVACSGAGDDRAFSGPKKRILEHPVGEMDRATSRDFTPKSSDYIAELCDGRAMGKTGIVLRTAMR